MNIIFDLDGTLIDSSERMYKLFQTLIPKSVLSKSMYWELKRNKVDHKMILEQFFPEISFNDFHVQWMNYIEKEEFVCMDQNYFDTINVLEQLKGEFELYLLTARQLKSVLKNELERLALTKYFSEIFVTEGKRTKKELLMKYAESFAGFLDEVKYFISDVGKDILLGNSFGLTTVGITHGFMNKRRLEEYQPDYIVDSLTEFLGLCRQDIKRDSLSYE